MKNRAWKRRDILKAGGLLAASVPLAGLPFKNRDSGRPISLPQDTRFKKPARPVTAVVLGAGSRGNWRNSKESNPMILSKSCHDLDILRRMIGKPCRRLSSFGSLKLFKAENAPPGSTRRCTDGCRAEADCPFSALKIYLRRKEWLGHLQIEDQKDESILKALKEGPYGRCVYHCDNDVVDHQVVNMEFEGEITAAFSMEAFTSYAGRRTRVMGTKGDVVGDMTTLALYDFKTRTQTAWDASKAPESLSGHGGGGFGLAHDFVQAVSQQDASLLTSTIEASMESHLMGFKAEESRLSGKTVDVRMG